MSTSIPTRGSTTTELYDRAKAIFPGGVLGANMLPERAAFIPFDGRGSRIRDVEGKEYIDYVLGSGPLILGHAHPSVVEAISKRGALGTQFFSFLNAPIIELAEEVCKLVPSAERVRFTSSGAEATFYALRLARAHTGRSAILKFEGGYHGHHDYAIQSYQPALDVPYPTPVPDSAGIPRSVTSEVLVAPFNDIGTTADIIDRHADRLAAVIVEPVQRALVPLPGFLEGLRELTRNRGICLVFDEVVTGFRLGLGGAQERFGVIPDLTALGKVIGGGLPLAAICGRADIMELCNPARKGKQTYVYQSGTLNGNPLGAVAGLATLRELKNPGTYAKLEAISDRLQQGIREVLAAHGLHVQVIGIGSIWQVVFAERTPSLHRELMQTDIAREREFDARLVENGISVVPGLRRFVSTAHTDDDLEATFKACDRAARGLGRH